MADIFKVAEIIEKMASGFEGAVFECLKQHEEEIPKVISEQLMTGHDGDGDYLYPTYDNDPYFNTPESGEFYKHPERYKEWKLNITPPQPSMMLGYSARPEEIPNLWIDGTFHSEIFATVTDDALEIFARGGDSAAIVSKFGEQILGLSDKGVGYLVAEHIDDFVWSFFGKCGW